MEQLNGNQSNNLNPPTHSSFQFIPANELVMKRPQWLIEDILESGTLGMLYGAPASGKSFLALDMGACVATGLDWHGNEVQQGGVLYFVGEGLQGIIRRKEAWSISHRTDLNYSMSFSTQFVDLHNLENSLPEFIEEIRKVSEQTEVKLLILDTLSRYYSGDENAAGDMNHFISVLDNLRKEFGFAVLLVHHTGKDASRGARGSSVLRAALDTEIQVQKSNDVISITNTKQKDFEVFPPRAFRLSQVELLDEAGEKLVDDHEHPITSCVLEETDPSDNNKTSLQVGTNQQFFDELYKEFSNSDQDSVPLAELKTRMDLPSNRWTELLKSKYFEKHYLIKKDYVYRKDAAVN
jgi:RecA-family ATPase